MPDDGLNESLVDRLLAGAFAGPATPAPQPADELPEGFGPRYRVEGVIGKGGVGIVLRGRDLELGRDVALKVLRKEHVGHEGLKRRFLEEAQIGGQLEHPGVVPVHEMGRASDDRPFFVMKLIQGRTLGELLGARRDLADDRSRFLAIFEQVALTVAYAHARGVIHRDLKPSNVMVGAFGEVQVADWGLAKVVGRDEPPTEGPVPAASGAADGAAPASRPDGSGSSAGARPISTVRTSSSELLSQAGAVLGTLSYMAPEQARGESSRVDARADVFALGAILLELLTGKPPYVGDSGEQFEAARRADLGPALARLDAAGADPALAALARRCLTADPAGRPADAGAVARALQEWRAGIDERARAAELAAAAARARVEEERRRRRVTLALAATIVVALLGGGAMWLTGEHEERERVERAAGGIRGALAGARELARQAAAEPAHAVAPRERALAAADSALAAARLSDPGAGLRAEVEALQRELTATMAEARAAAAERQRDQATLSVLTEQISRWFVAPWDEIDRAMTDAFRAWGLDLATMTDEQVVARVRASTEPIEFADHLLAWIKVRHELSQLVRGEERAPQDFGRLQRIVQEADPDPWRVRLRAAVPNNLALLEETARDPELWHQDLRTISHLGSMLTSFGKTELAFRVLQKASLLHPEEYSFRYFLALLAKEARLRQWELALDHASACVTMAPDAISAQMLLAVTRDALGDFDGAVGAWDAVLRLDPRSRQATAGRIWSLLYGGRHDDANAAIDAAEAAEGVASDATRHARAAIEIAAGRLDAAHATLKQVCAGAEALASVPTMAVSLGLAGDWAGAAEAIRAAQRRVTPFVPLDIVINLHATRSFALERAGDLDGARAALRQIEQILLQSGARPETMQRAGIERLDQMITLAEELPDYESGALEPADAVALARVGLLLARAGRLEAAFEIWTTLVPDVGNRAAILDAEPYFLREAAGATAQLAQVPSIAGELRERAVEATVQFVRAEARHALAEQGKDPAVSARSHVHTLLLDPKLRLLRDASLHAPLTAPQSEALAGLGGELRQLMRRTRG